MDETITEIVTDGIKFTKKCPVCGSPMAENSYFCSLKCYEKADGEGK